jgi:hypothetical protein
MRRVNEVFAVVFVTTTVGVLTDDWLIAASIPFLWAIWRFLLIEGGPPVLAFAMTYHWGQNVIGLVYHWLTGRQPIGMRAEMYPQMVVLGLVCIGVIVAGIVAGDALIRRTVKQRPTRDVALGWSNLFIFYFALLAFRGTLHDYAWTVSAGLTQGVLALTYIRFALFYLILRRLVFLRRWGSVGLFVALELTLGMIGYFAEFREPLFITVVVLTEQFDYRRASHWFSMATVSCIMLLTGVLWIGIRSPLREYADELSKLTVTERLEYSMNLAQNWLNGNSDARLDSVDMFVDRMWDVYYPALALARVPSTVPHTDGAIMTAALQHVFTPRILVPDKQDVESDSLQVRRFAGVWVAGPEQNTTISFGYPIQSYIDYGIPVMFVPIFLYAVLMGMAYRLLLRLLLHREISVAVVTVIFWMSLYAANKSWAKLLGFSLTLLVSLGGVTFLIDRYLASSAEAAEELERAAAAVANADARAYRLAPNRWPQA